MPPGEPRDPRPEVEAATVADLEELVALREGLARWMQRRGIAQWTPGGFPAARLWGWLREGSVLVRRDAGRIVGTVTVLWEDPALWPDARTRAGYIRLLMVARSHAGRGLGDALLAAAEDHTRVRGRRFARLDVDRDNAFLQDYYARRGYERVGRRSLPDRGYEAVLREKQLAAERTGGADR